MRIHQRVSITSSLFYLWLAFAVSLVAQDELSTIVKNSEPSIVVILSYDEEDELIGQGSGFFISHEGDVITNRHVLLDAITAQIRTTSGDIYPITGILAEDTEGDLIRVAVEMPLGDIKPLSVSGDLPETGDRILVIGTPLGLERTVSDGIISSVRDIPGFGKIIQITAPISPGSSGSPVINMKGEVVGVAALQLAEGQNLNFAIPAERVSTLSPGELKLLGERHEPGAGERLAAAEEAYRQGLIYLWAEDYEQALPYFEQAAAMNESDADAYFQIGYCNSELSRYFEEIEAYKAAIRINPDDAEAHTNLGVVYGKVGRYDEAIASFKQAIRINPHLAEAHYNLGYAYGDLGRTSEEIEAYKAAIRINPDDAAVHTNLGVAYFNLGRTSEAIEAYKAAIRINPDDADAHYSLGVVYGNLGRYDEAIEACKAAIRINPEYAAAHYNLGVVYGDLGRTSEAIEAYKAAIRINPDDAKAHFNLGLSYLIVANKSAALDEYKILKDIDRESANKLFNLIYR